jgi:crossover junction endodeoxyribonuclease RuvC
MRVLGIDPGTITMGYGVIEDRDDEVALVDCGALTTPSRSPIGERLSYLYNELLEIISQCQPDAVAIEQPFMAKNAQSALAVGRAQAVAILAAANRGIPSYEYTPAQVKQRVADYGASSKEQIQEMVRLQLGLSQVPEPNDAADALAVALCHLREVHLESLLAGRDKGEK